MFRQRRPPRPAAPTKRAFTIVEFLIVMALISILVAIILSLLISAREASNRVQCTNNLRQFAAAFYMYSQDFEGYWPSPGGLYGNRAYWSQTGSGGLNRYVKQCGLGSIWCCPLLTDWHGKFPPRSYSMNSNLRTPCDWPYPLCNKLIKGINLSKIGRPSKTVLLYEGIPFASGYEDNGFCEDQVQYVYRCANWSWVRGYTDKMAYTINPGKPWHGRLSNYLYCDGHVLSRPPGRKTVGTLSTYKEMYEWYADKDGFEATYASDWASSVPRE